MLTDREVASLILLVAVSGVVTVWALASDGRGGVLRAIGGALAALAQPRLLVPTLAYVGILFAALVPASRLGLWESVLWKATLTWMLVSGVGLFFSLDRAMKESGFFWRTLVHTVWAIAIVEFIATLESFPLWAELLAQSLALFAGLLGIQQECPGLRRAAKSYLTVFGLVAIGWSLAHVVREWSELDHGLLWREFLLPIWLTPIALLVVYVFAVWEAYRITFRLMRLSKPDESLVGQRLALVIRTGLWLPHLRLIRGSEGWINSTEGFSEAWAAIGQLRQQHREQVEAETAEKRRLVENAGQTGVDECGRQLDQREFAETKDVLRWVSTCHMGHYPNGGDTYRDDLLPILEPGFADHGLDEPSGVTMFVSSDGQSWYAERQTITGHWFAIGAVGPPSDEWLFDGPERPSGFPAEPEWDHWGGGESSVNWD